MNTTARRIGLLVGLGTAVTLISSGCSSKEAPPPAADTLSAGTAVITIGDTELPAVQAVRCVIAGPLTTISTGTDASGSTSVVSNADGLDVESVSIADQGGFTGSYHRDLGGAATVTMAGNTYTIAGTAEGFRTDKPSFRADGKFQIKVAC